MKMNIKHFKHVKIVNAKWGVFMLSNIYYDLGFKAFINYNKIDALKMTFDFIDLLSDLMWSCVNVKWIFKGEWKWILNTLNTLAKFTA